MAKHLSFWIGFFVASLLIVPIAVGVWGAAGEFAREVAAFTFGAIAVLVVLLVVFLFFREPILKALLGRGEATLDEVTGRLVQTVSATTSGDRARAEEEAKALAQTVVGWWAWSNLYRWVIASALGLLLAFGAFTGTVLLFEQTRKLSEQTELMSAQTELMNAQTERMAEQAEQVAMQNEIMTLNLVNELRAQLLASVEERSIFEWFNTLGIQAESEPLFRYGDATTACALQLDKWHLLRTPPSAASIGAISQLARDDALGNRVVNALRLLAQDSHGSVALGAVLALQEAGAPYEKEFTIKDLLLIEPVRLVDSDYRVNISRSFVEGLLCPRCELHITASFFSRILTTGSSGGFNVGVLPASDMHGNGIFVTLEGGTPPNPSGRDLVPLSKGSFFYSEWQAWLTQHKEIPPCEIMAEIARVNPLIEFK